MFLLDERRVSTRLQSIVMKLFMEQKWPSVSIVLIVLVEIYKIMNEVKVGMRYFKGSNLVFQLWIIKHLHSPSLIKVDVVDPYLLDQVEVIKQRMCFDKFSLPMGVMLRLSFSGQENMTISFGPIYCFIQK